VIRSRVPLVEPFAVVPGAASPAITAPPPDDDATCAFSSAAAIGAASRPGRARTLHLLRGSHDLTCSTGHQPATTASSSSGVRDRDGRARTAKWMGIDRASATASGQAESSTKGVWGVLWTCGLCSAFAFCSSGLVGTRVSRGVRFIKLAARLAIGCGGRRGRRSAAACAAGLRPRRTLRCCGPAVPMQFDYQPSTSLYNQWSPLSHN
jgi:hypothetical protein